MAVSKRRTRAGVLFVLLLLAASCSGCIQGDVFEFVAYDPATDTFVICSSI